MKEIHKPLVVIGGGPAGYSAAFRAASLGIETAIVEKDPHLGGVCLHRGCIPSKALLHTAEIIDEAERLRDIGITFSRPKIDIAKVREHKNQVIGKLANGLLAKSKGLHVSVVHGTADFSSDHVLSISGNDEIDAIRFDHCIIAAGSRPHIPAALDIGSEAWDSTRALEFSEIPRRLAVIGGGYIGLELGSVYAQYGSDVTIIEMLDRLLPDIDDDLFAILQKTVFGHFGQMITGCMVNKIRKDKDGIHLVLSGRRSDEITADRMIVSAGRIPNSDRLALERIHVGTDPKGFIITDAEGRTSIPHIFAVGDITGNPMLAHKGYREGKVAAEVIAGQSSMFDNKVIPSVMYTYPQLAVAGIGELQAKKMGVDIHVARFRWAASGKALSMRQSDGITKLIVRKSDGRLLGGGIVGFSAGEMISEIALAIEMGAHWEDLALTIHPHPTLAESMMEGAEIFYQRKFGEGSA